MACRQQYSHPRYNRNLPEQDSAVIRHRLSVHPTTWGLYRNKAHLNFLYSHRNRNRNHPFRQSPSHYSHRRHLLIHSDSLCYLVQLGRQSQPFLTQLARRHRTDYRPTLLQNQIPDFHLNFNRPMPPHSSPHQPSRPRLLAPCNNSHSHSHSHSPCNQRLRGQTHLRDSLPLKARLLPRLVA